MMRVPRYFICLILIFSIFFCSPICIAQPHLISIKTYTNFYSDAFGGHPVNPQTKFSDARDAVVYWVVTSNTTENDSLLWQTFSPDGRIVEQSNLTLNNQDGLSWAQHNVFIKNLNISGNWSVRVQYFGVVNESLSTNFTIITPLKNAGLPPNNVRISTDPLAPINYLFLLFSIGAVGLLLLFVHIWHLKERTYNGLKSFNVLIKAIIFLYGFFLATLAIYILFTTINPHWTAYALAFVAISIMGLILIQSTWIGGTNLRNDIRIDYLYFLILGLLFTFMAIFGVSQDDAIFIVFLLFIPFLTPGLFGIILKRYDNYSPTGKKSSVQIERRKASSKLPKPKRRSTHHDVFISYAHDDKVVADALCAFLEDHQIRCWIAPRDLLPGLNYGEELIRAIDNSVIMVLIFSSKSNNSSHTLREVEHAVNKALVIIPFRIENVEPSDSMQYYIQTTHWLDALTPPLERHLDSLRDTIKLLLTKEE